MCELSLLTKTLDCPPHLSSFQQLGERVSTCPTVSHAFVLLTPHRWPDLDPPQHSESLGSHQSRLDLSRHVVGCCDETPKYAEQPGVLPCCWTRDFVMYLLLLLAIGASTASPLGFQGTPMGVVNASCCHCLSLVRLRNDHANSTPAVPTMTSSLSSVRPRNVPVAQRGSSFAISPRTILKSTVSPTCANGLSHSLPLSRAHALRPSSCFTNRLSTYAACLTSHGRPMLLLSTL